MKRTKLDDRELPGYTRGEEIFNMTSHIVGAVIGIVFVTLCVITAAIHNNTYGIVSGAIYGLTMIMLYTMSSVYHGLKPNSDKKSRAKKVMQVIDHCTIFLLIAGSYTPFALCTFRQYNPVLGWAIFGIIWALAILGIVLNSIDLKKYKVFSMICYLAMGWLMIAKATLLPELLGVNGTILLILGGVAYTIGAVLYIMGPKKKFRHSIFHLFIVLGSLLQAFCILLYVM